MKLSSANDKLLIMMGLCLLCLWAPVKAAGQAPITGQSNLSYHVIAKIFMDGKLVSSPEIIAAAGQTASLSMTNRTGVKSLKIKMAINGQAVLKKNNVPNAFHHYLNDDILLLIQHTLYHQ